MFFHIVLTTIRNHLTTIRTDHNHSDHNQDRIMEKLVGEESAHDSVEALALGKVHLSAEAPASLLY